jgi:hypothetical protein
MLCHAKLVPKSIWVPVEKFGNPAMPSEYGSVSGDSVRCLQAKGCSESGNCGKQSSKKSPLSLPFPFLALFVPETRSISPPFN